MNLQLAKTCSTCQFSAYPDFKKNNMNWKDKKQGGLCIFNCSPQQVPQNPPYLPNAIKDATTDTEAYDLAYEFWLNQLKNTIDRAEERLENGEVYEYWLDAGRYKEEHPNYNYIVGGITNPTWEQCLQYHEDEIARLKAELNGNRKSVEKDALAWKKKWQARHEWDSWWKTNYHQCILIHRQTVCDNYLEGDLRRESFARGIVAGEHSLFDADRKV